MKRAVIKLKGDINYALPIMERSIEGCAYNPQNPVAGFRYKDFAVIVHSRDILLLKAMNEASAVEVMDFLNDIVNRADRLTEKVRTY